ncbi:hypothetical protein ABVT39_009328 [Epinephelus coioides]
MEVKSVRAKDCFCSNDTHNGHGMFMGISDCNNYMMNVGKRKHEAIDDLYEVTFYVPHRKQSRTVMLQNQIVSVNKESYSSNDKSPPQRHDLVRTNALTAVLQRGGDVSDRQEVMGEYMLQFGKYKGKPYRWLLENDVGYTIYLINKVEEEERAGTFNPQGNSKDSLLSFLDYARSFQEIEDLREYLLSRKPAPPVSSEGDNVVGFGARAKHTWRQIWESREDGYAAFIVGVKCIKNSKMYNLQQYLLQQQRAEACPPPAEVSSTSAASTHTSRSLVMEEDEELERATLNLPPSEFDIEFTTVKTPLPVPPQLLAIAPQLGIEEQTPSVFRQTSPCPAPPVPLDAPHQPAASVPGHDQDVAQWKCSQQQKIWMKTEMEALGLWPGSRPVRHLMNMLSLWRYPPQPELIDSISELPSPKYQCQSCLLNSALQKFPSPSSH